MKGKNLESSRTRTTRKLKKIEPYISKILYLTSFTIFSIDNFVIFPDFSAFLTGGHFFDIFVLAYLILFLVFILSLPFYFYKTIKGKIPSSKTRSFEMLSSLVLFIGSSVNNFISQINICITFKGNCYPGPMIVGIITLFIIAYLTWILEGGYNYPREKKYSKLTSQDFKRIETSLYEEILKIENEIQENLNLIGEETREITETLNWDYKKFTFKRLDKYSDMIEELFLCYRRLHFIHYNSEMKFFRAKGLIDDGEFEEGIKLLRISIKNLPSKSEKDPSKLAKKQHVLAVSLAKNHQYEDAYNIFMEILKNNPPGQVRRFVNYDVLGKVLEKQNHLKASVGATEKNYELLYNKLGLEAYYRRQIKISRIEYVVIIIIIIIIVIGFIFFIIFLFFGGGFEWLWNLI